jgi:hypothetical protein
MPCPCMFACEHANVAATRSCFARDWREHLRDRKQIRGGGVAEIIPSERSDGNCVPSDMHGKATSAVTS